MVSQFHLLNTQTMDEQHHHYHHHHHRRRNCSSSTSGANGDSISVGVDRNLIVLDTPDRKQKNVVTANGDMDSIDVDRIMVIPDTPDGLCSNQKNICEVPTVFPYSNSRHSRREDKAVLDIRHHPFSDNKQTLGTSSHPSSDYIDFGQNHRTGGLNLSLTLGNAPETVADKNLKLKEINQSNNSDVENGQCSHARSPGSSHHHNNKRVFPVFDHVGSSKGLKDFAPRRPSTLSIRSTRNGDMGKHNIGNDFLLRDANPVKGNDRVVNVASEHGTKEMLSMPSHGPRRPDVINSKRLVRNGCISPLNIAKAQTSAGSSSVSSAYAKRDGVSGGSQNVIDVDNIVVEQDGTSRSKEKGLLIHSSTLNGHQDRRTSVPNGYISPHSKAQVKIPAEGASVSSAYAEGTSKSGGSQNVIDIDDVVAKQNAARQSKGKGVLIHSSSAEGHQASDRGKVSPSAPSASRMLPVLNGSEVSTSSPSKRLKGPASSSSIPGDIKEIICLSSGGESLAGQSSMDHRGRPRRDLGPPIVVGDLSPEVRDCGPRIDDNDNETTAIQLQADEMMARELQEQLYNEIPVATSSEIPSESAAEVRTRRPTLGRGPRFNLGLDPSILREAPQMPPLGAPQRPSFRNRVRRGNQARNASSNGARRLRARATPPSMVASGSNGRLFPSGMDVQMRMETLEALEAVANGNIRRVNQLLQADRDFGEDDYEMLLALDENNHEHQGASTSRISNLPESTILTETTDICSICLDTPAIGDTIRHLPCLHKFHKDCIDTWLRRKRSCPICKSDV